MQGDQASSEQEVSRVNKNIKQEPLTYDMNNQQQGVGNYYFEGAKTVNSGNKYQGGQTEGGYGQQLYQQNKGGYQNYNQNNNYNNNGRSNYNNNNSNNYGGFNNNNYRNNQYKQQFNSYGGNNNNYGDNNYNNNNNNYNSNSNYNRNFSTNNFNNNNSSFNTPTTGDDSINAAQALKYITTNYPNIAAINENMQGYSSKLNGQTAPKFFVIKSFTEEDIHKVKSF